MQIEIKKYKLPQEETELTELAKLREEYKEFKEAVLKDDVENMVEEFFDVIQVMVHILMLKRVSTYRIRKGQGKHFKKLAWRGWERAEN